MSLRFSLLVGIFIIGSLRTGGVSAQGLGLGLPSSPRDGAVRIGADLGVYRGGITPQTFPVLRIGIDTHSTTGTQETKIDADLRTSPLHLGAWAFRSKNFYWGEKDESYDVPLRFSFGRRHLIWSELDEVWKLGQTQPLFAYDRLRPETQGLTGIFATTETRGLKFRFFFSFLSLPETQPNVSLSGGRFRRIHPQSIATPPETLTILNQPNALNYQITTPELTKILFRQSLGVSIETKPELPFFARVAYAYLPLNFFPLNVSANAISAIDINLTPRLLRQEVYSFDFASPLPGLSLPQLTMGWSQMITRPNEESIPDNQTTRTLKPAFYGNPWIKIETSDLSLRAGFLFSRGGIGSDVGPLAGQVSLSSNLYYRNAGMISVQKQFDFPDQKVIQIKTHYLREFSIDGQWLMGEIEWVLNRKLSLSIGADVISAKKPQSESGGAEFLSDLRALDRVISQVTYAF